MNDESNKEIETQQPQSMEDRRRIRRFGIQVPLYKDIPSKPSAQLTPEEYQDALERQRKYQEKIKQKWITPKNVVIGAVILSFDFTILQLLPYIVKMIGIHDQVLMGEWIVGVAGVVTVAVFIYIFTSEG
jgi:hypothetical protein